MQIINLDYQQGRKDGAISITTQEVIQESKKYL